MWPFKKEQRKLSIAKESGPGADRWLLAMGEREGFPMIVRMAEAYLGLAPLPEFNHRILVSVQMRNPRPDGFPSTEEGADLEALEVKLCGMLESGGDTLCALVITNNGVRDFIFQTRNVQRTKEELKRLGEIVRGFRAEIAIEPDPEWSIYGTFERMVGRSVQ